MHVSRLHQKAYGFPFFSIIPTLRTSTATKITVMVSPSWIKLSARTLATLWLCYSVQGKKHRRARSLASFLQKRADGATLDPYTVAGNAAVEEDAADVPMDHTTALTYVLSFCIIAAAVAGIFAATIAIKYRKRRRAALAASIDADAQAAWEKLAAGADNPPGTRVPGAHARDHFKRMGIFHPPAACLRQLDPRLPCRCPLCAGLASLPAEADPARNARAPARPALPGAPSRGRILPRRTHNDENAVTAPARVRPTTPVSPHEHEWTLLHDVSPTLGVPVPPRATPFEPARLAQMSPLSSLRSSLVRELEHPPMLSDDSGASSIRVVTSLNSKLDGLEDVREKENPFQEEASVTLETVAAFKVGSPLYISVVGSGTDCARSSSPRRTWRTSMRGYPTLTGC